MFTTKLVSPGINACFESPSNGLFFSLQRSRLSPCPYLKYPQHSAGCTRTCDIFSWQKTTSAGWHLLMSGILHMIGSNRVRMRPDSSTWWGWTMSRSGCVRGGGPHNCSRPRCWHHAARTTFMKQCMDGHQWVKSQNKEETISCEKDFKELYKQII